MQLASVDGAIGPAEEARIPITDEGLTRGDGAFEVARLYGGRPFAIEEHYERLGHTCAGLRLEADLDALRAEVDALLEAAGPVEALLRVILTRGGRRILTIEPLPHRPPSARVATVTYAPTRVLDGLKTLSYGANMLAGRLARERGFDEALLVTPHGRVLEGPTWTFFWVRGGTLLTPPLEDRILASITRARVIEARMWSDSGGVRTTPSRTQKKDDVGPSSTRPCGVTSRASSKPRSRAIRVHSMLAA